MTSIKSSGKIIAVMDGIAPPSWMTLIQQYIELRILSSDSSEVTLEDRREIYYTTVGETLYKIYLSKSFLKFLRNEEI